MASVPHLYGDNEDVEGVRLLGRGQRLPLALQLGHLHPLPAEQRVLTLRVADGHQQHVAVAILDGLVVDAAQVVSSQKALRGEEPKTSLFDVNSDLQLLASSDI